MIRCSLCGHTGPEVAVIFDHGREGVAMCSTANPAAANACAEREREVNELNQEAADV